MEAMKLTRTPIGGKMWNGYPVAGLVTREGGAGRNSILTMKSGIVTRGVLYDSATQGRSLPRTRDADLR